MGEGPITAPTRKRRPAWKLKPPHDALTQGIVVSGFGHLPAAEALFLHCEPETGAAGAGPGHEGANAWLRTLSRVAPISDADGKDERATAIAFTWTGLQALGLPPRRAGDLLGAVPGGHVSGRPAAPPRRHRR